MKEKVLKCTIGCIITCNQRMGPGLIPDLELLFLGVVADVPLDLGPGVNFMKPFWPKFPDKI
jgi:hypothetical protein